MVEVKKLAVSGVERRFHRSGRDSLLPDGIHSFYSVPWLLLLDVPPFLI